ncbi:2'-5' RNA ligase family protein [Streptomyces goshikiensis]|uniref:2'-5' RNA ligase family protein n=1 Tax=Streptomyces goshikiensis TaxID=1942 RepID=UPI0036CDF588
MDGMSVLHVYALPRAGVDDELLEMARSCVPLFEDYPIDPQCAREDGGAGLLHLTLEMLADAPAADYDPGAVRELVDALTAELADIAAFTTQAGPPIANIAGGVLDVWPDAQAVTLTERVRTVIRKTRGETALQHSTGRPHLSLGYAYGEVSSDRLNGRLRNEITPRRAPLRVDRVHLLDVTWAFDGGLGGWRMSWEPVAEIPLGG